MKDENKIEINIEFPIHASPNMLYQYMTNASGLSEWFAENVNISGKKVTFIWDGSEEEATIIQRKQDELVKYQWIDDINTNYYFQLKIEIDAITKDVSLLITDFADEDDEEYTKRFWETKIEELKHVLGSI